MSKTLLGFICLFEAVLQTFESDHDDAQVVQRLKPHGLDEERVDSITASLVELLLRHLGATVLLAGLDP